MEQFNAVKEIFLSLVKWFLVFVVVNNLLWVVVFGYYIGKTTTYQPTEITQNQEGRDNLTQEVIK
jgi:hypothetical protein